MTELFAWAPQEEAAGKVRLRMNQAQYGDGYSQRAGDGINGKSQTWNLTFKGNAARIDAIRAFLDARGGWQSFFWTPSLGVQGYYVAGEYDLTDRGANRFVLQASFMQVFFA